MKNDLFTIELNQNAIPRNSIHQLFMDLSSDELPNYPIYNNFFNFVIILLTTTLISKYFNVLINKKNKKPEYHKIIIISLLLWFLYINFCQS